MTVPSSSQPTPTRIHLEGIYKSFGSLQALRGVSLTLRAGEIHALLGQNGAGKTTLMKILYGLYRPDAGRILVDDRPVHLASPRDAMALGLGFVQQHFSLIDSLTVAENFALGVYPQRRFRSDAFHEAVQRFIDERGFAVRARQPVGRLSVGEKQRVEILKALFRRARFLILDEPTAVLSPAEISELFVTLRRLKARGIGIVFISHKLPEVLEISDRITVLRDGRKVGEMLAREASIENLTGLMLGRSPAASDETPVPGAPSGDKPALLQVESLHLQEPGGRVLLQDVSFTVHAGEILGVAGVDGNGQRELAEIVLGLRRPDRGRVLWVGAAGERHSFRPAVIPQNRHPEGIVDDMTVAENALLTRNDLRPFQRHGMLSPGRINRYARHLIERFEIVCRGPEQRAGELSGGNQQKLMVGRALMDERPVLIAMNPGWGVDVAATRLIHRRLRDKALAGSGVLLISTDLDEIYALSDRFFVLYNGRTMGWATPETPKAQVGRWMMGVERAP